MNRAMLKDRAKGVLKSYYVKLLGVSVIAALATLKFIGVGTTTDAVNGGVTGAYLQIFALRFQLVPSRELFTMISLFSLVTLVLGIFVFPVITYGLENVYKYAAKNDVNRLGLFDGFQNNYKNIVFMNFMRSLFIFLWALLLFVPGIVKAYKWRFANQILEENPDWNWKSVLAESERLTEGHKGELFVLDLSFILWYIGFALLDLFTFGLADYLLSPYITATDAEAYHWLKALNEPDVIDVEANYVE